MNRTLKELWERSQLLSSPHHELCAQRLAEARVAHLPSRHPVRQGAVAGTPCNCHLGVIPTMQRFQGAVLLALAAVVLLLTGCKPPGIQEDISTKPEGAYRVVVLDGCEYLEGETYRSYYSLTHKGNCSNPVHRLR